MEFKSLKDIESSYKSVRRIFICFSVFCLIITVGAVAASYVFAERQRHKIYVLDQGKSLMLALSQDEKQNRPVELREHVRRFHMLFFTLAPEKTAIEDNINRALKLSDQSAYEYYRDLKESRYYDGIIRANINQYVQIDSLVIDYNQYPYNVITYATQRITRRSNITYRRLITSCEVRNSVRSDDNPQGFLIEKFKVLNNSDIETTSR